ncbi:MAG: hypothetical protein LIR50_03205 [Bacillota bacterium]|nr:hypothetical protein [Bacillota bacterium]
MGKPVLFQINEETNKDYQRKFIIEEDNRDIIDGIILDNNNNAVADAVVKLYIMNKEANTLEPISYTFTDEYGEFAFGPVNTANNYLIKVWYYIKEDNPIKINLEPINDLTAFLNEANLDTAEFCQVECEYIT